MSQERFTAQIQARGADGSGPVFKYDDSVYSSQTTHTGDGTAEATIGNTDGIDTPSLYTYTISPGSMANSSNKGTVASKDSSEYTSAQVGTGPKALQVERSNMRFHNMLAKLSEKENMFEFAVASETYPTPTGADVGCPTAASYTVSYERKPVHHNSTYADGAETVRRLVAEGILFAETDGTTPASVSQTRHVFYPANTVSAYQGNQEDPAMGDHPQTMVRESVTAEKFANAVADLYANVSVTGSGLANGDNSS